LDCAVFFMDMRTYGKDFERYYEGAKGKQGVRFPRSKVHTIDAMPDSDDLSIRYVTESGEMQTEVFDMVVLSVGLETSPEVVAMAESLGVGLTPGNFCQTSTFAPVTTSRAGVYVCGAFQGPKDIPQAVVDASAAAAAAGRTAQFGKEHPDPHQRGRSRNQCPVIAPGWAYLSATAASISPAS
jgi:heterodisulfide reductase subunit A